MIDLQSAMDRLKFDTRMKEWVLKQGMTTKEELEKYLNGLPDSKNDSESVTLEDRPDFGD